MLQRNKDRVIFIQIHLIDWRPSSFKSLRIRLVRQAVVWGEGAQRLQSVKNFGTTTPTLNQRGIPP